MPNYYAHLRFGTQVLAGLPEYIRTCIAREYDAFLLGHYGPDPLYFSRSKKARALGRIIHHRPVKEIMGRMRTAVEKQAPFAAGYAAGFLCHFALDSSCHTYIKQCTHSDRLGHAKIETEFDRFLMAMDGVDIFTPMPNPAMPVSFYGILEQYIYPEIKGADFKNGMNFYQTLNNWHAKTAQSKPAEKMFDLIWNKSRQKNNLGDMIFIRESIGLRSQCEDLLKIMKSEVLRTTKEVEYFCSGTPFGEWYDRDFFGA